MISIKKRRVGLACDRCHSTRPKPKWLVETVTMIRTHCSKYCRYMDHRKMERKSATDRE